MTAIRSPRWKFIAETLLGFIINEGFFWFCFSNFRFTFLKSNAILFITQEQENITKTGNTNQQEKLCLIVISRDGLSYSRDLTGQVKAPR
jgi:hypothetical protein